MVFCTECGTQVPDGVSFCTACGKSVGNSAPPDPVAATAQAPVEAETPVEAPPPQQQPPQPANPATAPGQSPSSGDVPPAHDSPYAVMSVGSFIGHSILFSIPVVGWLSCLIMAFVSKNLNKKNFARAALIFLIIGIVLSILVFLAVNWMSQFFMQQLNIATDGIFNDFSDMGELFDLLK